MASPPPGPTNRSHHAIAANGRRRHVPDPAGGLGRSITWAELKRLVSDDPQVVVATAGSRTGINGLQDPNSGRVPEFSGPPSDLITHCAALARGGSRPILFLSRADLAQGIGRVIDEVSRPGLPVLIMVEDTPSLSGSAASAPEESTDPPSLGHLRWLPEMVVMISRNRRDLREMMRLALDSDGPAVIVLPDSRSPEASTADDGVAWGRADVLADGDDVTFLAVGPVVEAARRAVHVLDGEGISAGLIDLRFLQPLDTAAIHQAAGRSARLVALEESPSQSGLGAVVLDALPDVGPGCAVQVLRWPRSAGRRVPRIVEGVRRIRDRSTASQVGDPSRSVVWRNGANGAAARSEHEGDRGPDLQFPKFSEREMQREQDLILATTLSPVVEEWVAGYATIGERPYYLWQWCRHGLELLTLPCVRPDLRASVCDTKLLAVLLGVLLDDVADRQRNGDFLDELVETVGGRKLPDFRRFSPEQRTYAEFTCRLWDTIQTRLQSYPCYEVFAELLQYDTQQILNTMRYSRLINTTPNLLNLAEHDLYLPHNMQMMSFLTIDLMCSPQFNSIELGKLRQAVWHAQCMGRIGNLISTWEREIDDLDYSSGVFARALLSGDLTVKQLVNGNRREIETAVRSGDHEEFFLRQWEHHRSSFRSMKEHIQSFNLDELLDGLDRLLCMELVSRGRK